MNLNPQNFYIVHFEPGEGTRNSVYNGSNGNRLVVIQ